MTSRYEIWGVYINNNTQPILDGPNSVEFGIDTLKIYADHRFVNKSWGLGHYQIKNGILTTEIEFSYNYELGEAGFSTIITKPLFGEYKIWLNKDLNFYYLKAPNE
jgi:hypothetical protein